jgi:hypothetical protein
VAMRQASVQPSHAHRQPAGEWPLPCAGSLDPSRSALREQRPSRRDKEIADV